MTEEAKRPGRRSKLTRQLIESLCETIEAGNHIRVACQSAGIGESSYYRWLERAEGGAGGIYREFQEAIKKAEGVGEAVLVEQILADASWQAKAWYLERRYPERWGRRDRLDSNVQSNVKVTFATVREMTEEEWDSQIVNGEDSPALPA